jgi:uncharacterized DUF497 family protein
MVVVIKKIMWDKWNLIRLFENQIHVREVDEVCHNAPLFQEDQEETGRAVILGSTDSGRILFVGGSRQGRDAFYPIEMRTATELECGLYKRHQGRGGKRCEPKEARTREQEEQLLAHGFKD